MKTLLLITTIGLMAFTAGAQNKTGNVPEDRNKTEMQQSDTTGKHHKNGMRKMNHKKNDESNRKMDNYPSNRQGSSNPAEQRHMDSTINNHR